MCTSTHTHTHTHSLSLAYRYETYMIAEIFASSSIYAQPETLYSLPNSFFGTQTIDICVPLGLAYRSSPVAHLVQRTLHFVYACMQCVCECMYGHTEIMHISSNNTDDIIRVISPTGSAHTHTHTHTHIHTHTYLSSSATATHHMILRAQMLT
jgi:hypothetical protein